MYKKYLHIDKQISQTDIVNVNIELNFIKTKLRIYTNINITHKKQRTKKK